MGCASDEFSRFKILKATYKTTLGEISQSVKRRLSMSHMCLWRVSSGQVNERNRGHQLQVPDYAETGLLWSLSVLSKVRDMGKSCDDLQFGIEVIKHKRVLEVLKRYNNDVKYGYVQRELTDDEVEYLKLFKKEIEVRLNSKLQTAEDLQGDALLHYDAEMELMNLILLSIPNDIYNSVDACTSAKDMWKRVERLMRGTIQNKVDRETRFTNEFDQFVAEPGSTYGNVQRTLRTSSSGNTSTVQCYNYSGKGHYARNCPKPRVWDSKYFMEQMLLAKQDEAGVILTDEQNDFLFADASRMEEKEN
ncbi:retrovirus-related pol polyprotein from transposon TNT 1-94 [Tanacetum coccineum]